MKLRSQLVVLVAGTSALFLGSVAGYFALMAPIEVMQREAQLFQQVDRAASNLIVQGNLLVIEPLASQTEAFQAGRDRWNAAVKAFSGVVELPKVSEDMAQAVASIQKLGALTQEGQAGVATALEVVARDAADLGITSSTVSWSALNRMAFRAGVDENLSYLLQSDLAALIKRIQTLNQALTVTQGLIQKKDETIQAGLAQVKDRSSLVGLVAILAAVALAVALSLALAQNITKGLLTLGGTVAKVGSGDLRVRLRSRRKDELGTLARDIDAFLDTLTAAFQRIQTASAENLQVKDQLVQSVGSATASAVQIEANSSSILAQLRKADERIQASQADLNGVVVLLEAFHTRLGQQGEGVTEATRAVAELAQGIAQISRLSDENRQAVEALLAESDRGREVFDRSFAKVAEISDSVAAIQDLVGAIADIASQTNILALNAAIEAAHAGEAGKGFAVVSDEIGKLAAASAASSAQIAATIQEVVGKIREAAATREETLGAFDAIGGQIGLVSNRGRSIYAEADHMNQGTHRIRQVMESLASSAEDTTREADRISTVATELGDALGQVGRISHEVVSNIGEITSGLAEISQTITEVQGQSDRLGRVGESLDEAVNAFQTAN